MKSTLSTAELWQTNIQLNSLDKIETDKVIHNVGFDIESSENKFHVASNQSLGGSHHSKMCLSLEEERDLPLWRPVAW